MSIIEKEVFNKVVDELSSQYPKRNIAIVCNNYGDELVTVDDEIKFNTTGYNLLYNLIRLCNSIDSELI